jgi:undecaprenyl-diphosphatase
MHLPERSPSLREAVALGLLQGPSELLPISSSAHLSLVPWLAGWRYGELDGEERKPFEIALHAGAGLALALALRRELSETARESRGRKLLPWALALTPPALLGLILRGPIARHLAGPRSIATGLFLGAVAMTAADLQTPPAGTRGIDDFGAMDGLALGIAQALALAPGVSRNGATLAAARARGYGRSESQSLSWRAGLPVILGASGLEATRLAARRGLRARGATLALGAATAAASTQAFTGSRGERALRPRSLMPYSVYRCALAALVVVRLRRAQ